MSWYDNLGFEDNPYDGTTNPMHVEPISRFAWNRPDLPVAKKAVDRFLEDVINGEKVGLKIVGPNRGGKTWLIRIIQKEILEKDENVLFIYAKASKIEPLFPAFYERVTNAVLKEFDKIELKIREELGNTTLTEWNTVFKDNEDLANCFALITQKTHDRLAKRWLTGGKLNATQLNTLDVVQPLDDDDKKLETLKQLIRALTKHFNSVVLAVDELERVKTTKTAGILSDNLREIYDGIQKKFGLICSFSGSKVSEWFSLGFSQALGGRIKREASLEPLTEDSILEFMRIHQNAYRKPGSEPEDGLHPFTEDGIKKILSLMSLGNRFPGLVLNACEDIVRAANEQDKLIDENFVNSNLDLLSEHMEAQQTLK